MGSVRWFGKALVTVLLFGCASTEQAVEDVAKRAALMAARPVLEKLFLTEAPVSPSSRDLYPLVKTLPGKSFSPSNYFKNRLQLTNGVLKVSPGDYILPVMTYCMKSSGSSPSAHRYSLGKLSGTQAGVIRDLNARALSLYAPHDVQVLSWSIQNGIPYEEMSAKSKEIVGKVIPEYQSKLKSSFYQSLSEKWNGVAEKTGLPNLNEVTDEMLSSLGTFGESVRDIRDFRKKVRESSFEYDSLRSLISLPGPSQEKGNEETTPWSQISTNVFARFLTTGHYLDVGQLQIRVVESARSPKALKESLSSIDISSLVADPGVGSIQPLSFSALFGGLAVGAIPAQISPVFAAAVIAAILAERFTDWDAFTLAIQKFGQSTNETIRDLIQRGLRTLSKEHDELEKTARDAGLLEKSAKDTTNNPGNPARIYEKTGGKEALEKDFNKFPGEVKNPAPGVRVKTLPNGNKVIARDGATTKSNAPTIEFQPSFPSQTRIKIRYP